MPTLGLKDWPLVAVPVLPSVSGWLMTKAPWALKAVINAIPVMAVKVVGAFFIFNISFGFEVG
jgi:hypothetical protein